MSFLDITFCASPHCLNACGRQMNHKERFLLEHKDHIKFAYLCGDPEFITITDDYALERQKSKKNNGKMGIES